MSTKTTFKRIALVAVAALGLSLVAVAPSSAVPQVDTLTASALTATAAPGAAASVTLTHTYLSTGTSDTVTATVSISSMPAGNTALPVLASVTTNDTGSPTKAISGLTASTGSVAASTAVRGDYTLSLTTLTTGTYVFIVTPQSGSKASALTLTYTIADTAAAPTATASRVYMRSGAANGVATAQSLLLDGNGYAQTAKIDETGTVTYTQATLKTNLVAHIAAADTNTANVTTLSVSGGISTVGTTVATFGVILANGESLTASTISGAVQKSYDPYTPQAGYYFNAPGHPVTATVTGPGLIAYSGATKGKTYTEVTADGAINYLQKTFSLVSDGTNGASTITFTAGGVTLATRTVNFVGTTASYAFGTPTKSVVGVGETMSVTVTGADSLGTTTGAASVYAFSSDATIATVNTTQASTVVITGVKSGTATITVGNASTLAASTITKTLAVKVGAITAKTVAFSMSPTAPQPGEKVTLTVTATDASGNPVGDGSRNLFSSTGIATSLAVQGATWTANTAAVTLVNGTASYTFYAPTGTGTLEVSATEGTSTDSTTKAAITGSVTIVNSAVDAATDAANEAYDAANAATDAALAAAEAADAATVAAQEASDAVAALSESVTKLIAGLQAQIKSLAAVVAKIAKKVKA
jgi:hypothetical protein